MKVEKMKQNKNSPVVRVASAALATFVLMLSFSIPTFAYTDTSVNGIDFSEQPYLSSDHYSYSTSLVVGKDTSNRDIITWFLGPGTDYYLAGVANGASYVVYVISSTQNSQINIGTSNGWMSPITDTWFFTNNSVDYYYTTGQSYSITSTSSVIPLFSSRDALKAALQDWLENPPIPPASPAVAQFVLPAGNAVVIDLGGWDNSLTDKKIQLSQTTQYVHPQQWSTNQYYAYTDSLPSSISTPFSGQNPINWYGNGKTNLFNQTNSFVANFIYNSSLGRYLVIINPFVPEDHDTDNYNSPLSVYVGQCSGYKFYQLKTDVSQIGAFGGESDGTTGTGIYDPSTGTWSVTNDLTGDPWSPTQGGANSNNVVLTVSGWLEQISHQISDFFAGAIGAVTNLVSAGSDFIHSLSGLYAWLPAPVYAVLTSALILVITIGVIKVFI